LQKKKTVETSLLAILIPERVSTVQSFYQKNGSCSLPQNVLEEFNKKLTPSSLFCLLPRWPHQAEAMRFKPINRLMQNNEQLLKEKLS
jgi:hypothetical protein